MPATRVTRPLAALHLAWAGLLLAGPARPHRRAGSRQLRAAARILAARHAIEALLLIRRSGGTGPPRWPIAVDGLHAVTMLVLAGTGQRYRRPAITSAAVAGLFTLLQAAILTSPAARGGPPLHPAAGGGTAG